MVEKVDFFEYDTSPTEDNEIVIAFKVIGIGDCEMKISEKTLRDMLAWIDSKTLFESQRRKEES